MVVFLGGTVFWIVLFDVILLDVILNEPTFLVIFGIAMPIIWFLIFLLIVRSSFLNYHEITERKLVISAPTRRISIPLEEIIEIKSDVGSIETEFGKSRWDVKYETYEPGEYYFDFDGKTLTLKYKEGYLKKGRSISGEITYGGASFSYSDGVMRVISVFSDRNIILIKAKGKEIIFNVPDAQEFVTEALKAIRFRKSSLKL